MEIKKNKERIRMNSVLDDLLREIHDEVLKDAYGNILANTESEGDGMDVRVKYQRLLYIRTIVKKLEKNQKELVIKKGI